MVYMLIQLHVLPPLRQEVCDPLAGGVRHAQQGELFLMVLKAEQTGSWHRFLGIPDAGRCTGGPCTVHSIVCRLVVSVGELQGVQ